MSSNKKRRGSVASSIGSDQCSFSSAQGIGLPTINENDDVQPPSNIFSRTVAGEDDDESSVGTEISEKGPVSELFTKYLTEGKSVPRMSHSLELELL